MVKFEKVCGKEGYLHCHDNLDYHQQAIQDAKSIRHLTENPKGTVPYMMSDKQKENYDRNFHVLQYIVKALVFCGKQNIPIRGHLDSSTSESSNKGNFLALLDLMAENDPILRHHLEKGKRNAKGTSNTIQNEILDIIRAWIRQQITAPLQKDTAVFSIIADEVTDCSNKEVLSVCLRFLDTSVMKEVFFDYIYLERTTGEYVAEALKGSLKEHNIDIKKARGQSYDGAPSMSSEKVGVQRRIREESPRALYSHCKSHILNLSIAGACKDPNIRNMVDTINEVYLFYSSSPKRQSFLENILEENSESRKRKLPGLCKTRWVERHTCFESFYELYPYIIMCLQQIAQPEDDSWSWDKDNKIRAQGLETRMRSSSHIIAFFVAKNTLEIVKPIAVKLQKREQDVIQAYSMIDSAIDEIHSLRADIENQCHDWYEEATKLAERIETTLSKPRITSRQRPRASAGTGCNLSDEEYFQINFCIPFVDHLESELRARFDTNDRKGSAILALVPHSIRSHEDLKGLTEDLLFWEEDIHTPSSLFAEIKRWKNFWVKRSQEADLNPDIIIPENLVQSLEFADEDI